MCVSDYLFLSCILLLYVGDYFDIKENCITYIKIKIKFQLKEAILFQGWEAYLVKECAFKPTNILPLIIYHSHVWQVDWTKFSVP